VSRKSFLSRPASSLVEPELPLRAYFLSVGGALLLLLLAANWVQPAALPSRLMDSHSALPPIRIHSELKGPEAVVIAVSRFEQLPMLPEDESAVAPSQLPSSDVADAAKQPGSPEAGDGSKISPATLTDTHLRESLAQLQPAVPDRAGRGRKPREITARQRKLARTWSEKRRRSARHPETSFGGCVSVSPEHDPCRYALVPN
jgi:hypothetical protein